MMSVKGLMLATALVAIVLGLCRTAAACLLHSELSYGLAFMFTGPSAILMVLVVLLNVLGPGPFVRFGPLPGCAAFVVASTVGIGGTMFFLWFEFYMRSSL